MKNSKTIVPGRDAIVKIASFDWNSLMRLERLMGLIVSRTALRCCVVVLASCGFILLSGCDGNREKSRNADSIHSNTGRLRPNVGSMADRATKSGGRKSESRRFCSSLFDTTREQAEALLRDESNLAMFLSLTPEEVDGLMRRVQQEDRRKGESPHRLNVLGFYFEKQSQKNPDIVASYIDSTPGNQSALAALALARHQPELAFTCSLRASANHAHEEYGGQIPLARAVGQIASADAELACKLINATDISDPAVVRAMMEGFAEFDREKYYQPSDVAELIGKLKRAYLNAYPIPAELTRMYCGTSMEPEVVLASFPIDGDEWQRQGAIAYINGCAKRGEIEFVSGFLQSSRGGMLTAEERQNVQALLEHSGEISGSVDR